MRLGVQLPEVERVVRWPEYVAIARAAEESGFDSIWLGDHLLYRDDGGAERGPWDAWTLLAALAAVTEHVRLGPLVACTAFGPPWLLARRAAAVAEISGGRLVLGLGAGWNEPEFRGFGFPFDHRIDRFEEAFTIVRTLLHEGRIDFEGKYHQARDCELLPAPARPGGPPLLIGSIGPRMLRITLPHVQAWNVWYADTANTPEGLEPHLRLVDEVAREVGRKPADIERTVAVFVQLPGGRGRRSLYSSSMPPPPLAGTPSQIADGLRAYARIGVAEVQLVVDPITLESIEALAPVLEDLDRG
jgi:alkanesulfonate monooxygenase SsuD/methylene tetrahydromethanopterin reductase-like flavin-dependent oxidoreductase (luciferase family)